MKKKVIILGLTITIVFVVWFYNRRHAGLDLTPLKEYAINTTPCLKEFELEKSKGISLKCSNPPLPSKRVIYLLNRSEVNVDYKKYVIQIFLELFSQQLLKYHQCFEVRESPFFWE